LTDRFNLKVQGIGHGPKLTKKEKEDRSKREDGFQKKRKGNGWLVGEKRKRVLGLALALTREKRVSEAWRKEPSEANASPTGDN
jgi:hypothetical protein